MTGVPAIETSPDTPDVTAAGPSADLTYTYRPSLLGAAWSFRLTPAGLVWEAGRKSGRAAYCNVSRVRLSFKPASMQSHRYMTEIWADGAPKLEIVSSSWKSMVEQERLDKSYTAFVTELHRRIVEAGATPVWSHGSNPFLYWPGVVVFAGVSLALAFLVVRALQTGAVGGAAFIGAFLAVFLWQAGTYFSRNKPGIYSAEALPQNLLP